MHSCQFIVRVCTVSLVMNVCRVVWAGEERSKEEREGGREGWREEEKERDTDHSQWWTRDEVKGSRGVCGHDTPAEGNWWTSQLSESGRREKQTEQFIKSLQN